MAKLSKREQREIKAYCNRNGRRVEKHLKTDYDKHDLETSACDLLANLMHLATSKGWDWYEIECRARGYHNEELIGGELGLDR